MISPIVLLREVRVASKSSGCGPELTPVLFSSVGEATLKVQRYPVIHWLKLIPNPLLLGNIIVAKMKHISCLSSGFYRLFGSFYNSYAVVLDFLAQRISVQAKNLGCLDLISIGCGER